MKITIDPQPDKRWQITASRSGVAASWNVPDKCFAAAIESARQTLAGWGIRA